MKTLVTGATGFLGRAVARRLRRDGDVIELGLSGARSRQLVCDLRDAQAWADLLKRERPDRVVNCAAYRDPDFCETNPGEARRLNVDPVRVLAETLPPEALLMQISSDYVFDGETPPYSEADSRRPLNVYGATKVEAEDWTLRRSGSLVLRMPLLVGRGASIADSGYLSGLLSELKNPTPRGVDDLSIRFPTWIEDVAEAIAFLFDQKASGLFHFSGEEGLTRWGCLHTVARVTGLSADHLRPLHQDSPKVARRPRNSQLSVARIRSLGFVRRTPFEDGVRSTLAPGH
ncbi:MAG: SDR family oxidoreductase [Kiritimatiellia bacterium]|nr:SDR family oxidoreductase [Kiritimatiellia bacterium]